MLVFLEKFEYLHFEAIHIFIKNVMPPVWYNQGFYTYIVRILYSSLPGFIFSAFRSTVKKKKIIKKMFNFSISNIK